MKSGILWMGIMGLLAVQAQGQIHLEAGGGIYKPNGDSARFFKSGYRGEVGVEVETSPNVSLIFSGAYNRNKGNSAEMEAAFRESHSLPSTTPVSVDADAQIFEVIVSPKFYLTNSETLGAYLIGGGGPRWFKRHTTVTTQQGTGSSESSERSLGVHLGFGVEASISQSFRLGFRPVYNVVFSKDHTVQYAVFLLYLKI
jgi:hypothetical protein